MSSLLEQVYGTIQRKNVPFEVHIEITYECNLHCCHCYIVKEPLRKELTFEEIKGIIDQLKEEGSLFLTLTGGEPLTRKDFFNIASYIREKGLSLQIFTNGTLITPYIADRIRELNPTSVSISLYGATARTHNAVTGTHGSYRKTFSAIKFLRERGVPVIIKCVLMEQNFNEYNQILELGQKFGTSCFFDPILAPRDDGSRDVLKYSLSDEDLGHVFSDEKVSPYSHRACKKKPKDFLCDVGKTVCSISPYGDVYPCVQLHINAGNLRKKSFSQIWRFSEQMLYVRNIKVENLPECYECELLPYCSRCPGLAYLESGDLLAPSSASCRVARIISNIKNQTSKIQIKNRVVNI